MSRTPTDIRLHQVSKVLELRFDDDSHYQLPCEYLRVYSPSAEVRGHGPGQEVLQVGKEDVNIKAIEPEVSASFFGLDLERVRQAGLSHRALTNSS